MPSSTDTSALTVKTFIDLQRLYNMVTTFEKHLRAAEDLVIELKLLSDRFLALDKVFPWRWTEDEGYGEYLATVLETMCYAVSAIHEEHGNDLEEVMRVLEEIGCTRTETSCCCKAKGNGSTT